MENGDETLLKAKDDAKLILRIAKDRDRDAFRELYERYAGRIKGAMIRSGARNDEADETAQEAMLAIWRKAGTFDPARAPASAWIFTIARNRRIDMIRKTNRPMPDPNDPLYAPDPPTPAEAEVAIEMRNAKVRDALSSLSTDQRTAVHLAFFEGLSHAEVAKSMDTPLGTVKSRLRLAAARLRGALSDEFKEELLND